MRTANTEQFQSPLILAGVLTVAWAVIGLQPLLLLLTLLLQVVFAAFLIRHLAFALSANRLAPFDLKHPPPPNHSFTPGVSVVVSCKNEEAVIDALVGSLLGLDYPMDKLELIVVDDASDDDTGRLLHAAASAHPELICLHRPPGGNTGKSAGLNYALDHASGEVIVVFDADHRPRPDVVRRLVRHFEDPQVGAVQGRCIIGNPGDALISRLVSLDYLAGYLVNEYGRQSVFRLPAYGGANCAVRASSVRAMGGWNVHSVTEDTDLTMRLVLAGQKVRFDVHAVDVEEGAVTLKTYWRQRYRWARGHQRCWREYRRAVWRSPALTVPQKMETIMFLLVFHVPAFSFLGLVGAAAWGTVAGSSLLLGMAALWPLLFLGALLELGGGLLVAGADRRNALILPFFVPLFLISVAVCVKAWVDGSRRSSYSWVKTARSRDQKVDRELSSATRGEA